VWRLKSLYGGLRGGKKIEGKTGKKKKKNISTADKKKAHTNPEERQIGT